MTDQTQTVERIAEHLSAAQKRYLDAVAKAGAPYGPRHGTTANWALRHKLVEIVVRFDGNILPWLKVPTPAAFGDRVEILGQALTPLGLAVRKFIQEQGS